jgi:hypothetical protein
VAVKILASHNASSSVNSRQTMNSYAPFLQVLPDIFLDFVDLFVDHIVLIPVPLVDCIANYFRRGFCAACTNLIFVEIAVSLMAIHYEHQIVKTVIIWKLSAQS